MGAKGASEIIFKKEISEAAHPAKKLMEKEAEYAEKFATPYLAAERGYRRSDRAERDKKKTHQGICNA